MAKRSSGKPRATSLRAFRSDVAALKKAGLISSRVDARKQQPTRHMKAQLKRFANVLDGTAKAVRVPRAKAREYADIKDVKFDRVIMRIAPGDDVRWSASQEAIIAKRRGRFPGIKSQREILRPRSEDTLPPLPKSYKKKGKYYRYTYAVPIRIGNRIERLYFDSEKDLARFMSTYEKPQNPKRRAWKNWREYVEVMELEVTKELAEERYQDDGKKAQRRAGSKSSGKKAKAKGKSKSPGKAKKRPKT
jgi:hypothetical protein